MGDRSLIEWTDATWNPIVGCTKVSAGCDNCYAVRATARTRPGVPFEKVELYPNRLDQPLRWKRPRKVFVNSLSDLFQDDVPVHVIHDIFAVMSHTPQHTFQILTKRPGRMASLLTSDYFPNGFREDYGASLPWPLPNVWLGVSVENQRWAEIRIPKLLETPAAIRFLSCEPLLGPLDLSDYIDRAEYVGDDGHAALYKSKIDWIIVGGESGPGARPMHPDWVRALRDQAVLSRHPRPAFFFKQWGEWAPDAKPWTSFAMDAQMPRGDVVWMLQAEPDLVWRLQRVGKKRAGRELDGRTWDEIPHGDAAKEER